MNKDVTTLQHTLEYSNQGFSAIPLVPKTKLAAVSWDHYQTILASEDQIRTVDHLYHVAKGRDWQRLTSVSSYPNLLHVNSGKLIVKIRMSASDSPLVYGATTRNEHGKRFPDQGRNSVLRIQL
jgi:hypothetical protein